MLILTIVSNIALDTILSNLIGYVNFPHCFLKGRDDNGVQGVLLKRGQRSKEAAMKSGSHSEGLHRRPQRKGRLVVGQKEGPRNRAKLAHCLLVGA